MLEAARETLDDDDDDDDGTDRVKQVCAYVEK